MESKNFVKQQVDKLAIKYPFSTIRYYFHSIDNDHFVCIKPKTILNKIMANKEAIQIDMAFMGQFPNELLSFVDDDSFINDSELVYDKKMSMLELVSKNLEAVSIDGKNDSAFEENIEKMNIAKFNEHSTAMFEIEEDYAFAA